jgi:predicted DNA-binding protein with PD1-like motif
MGKVEGRTVRIIVANLSRGSDLLGSLEGLARETGIQGGFFMAIGAVQKAAFSYYDQSSRQYLSIKKEEGLEMTSCSGNFGIFEGKPRIHCHVTFCDRDGRTFGGHLLPGTEVFVGEVHLVEVEGVKLERTMDPDTGIAMLNF